jgi:hypothetical protein
VGNEPGIEGFAVISGTRIILPVEVSSIDGSVSLPSIGTIGTIQFANISVGTVVVGTVAIVLDTGTVGFVGTIGSIQAGAVTATVSGGLLADVGTVGTLQAQSNIAVASLVGSIGSPILIGGGTISTLQAGNVTASVSGGQLSDVGTVGTIQSPVAVVGTVQSQSGSYVFTSVSATIKGSPGVLYQVNVSGESGLVSGPGTLLILDGTATVGVVPVAAGGFVSAPFTPGVGFGTLIGSVIGSVDATFVIR